MFFYRETKAVADSCHPLDSWRGQVGSLGGIVWVGLFACLTTQVTRMQSAMKIYFSFRIELYGIVNELCWRRQVGTMGDYMDDRRNYLSVRKRSACFLFPVSKLRSTVKRYSSFRIELNGIMATHYKYYVVDRGGLHGTYQAVKI